MSAIAGRVALVTGGARGIGQGVAVALGAAGARVVINYRQAGAEAEAVVTRIRGTGGEAIAVQADVSRPDEAAALVDAAERAFGAVGILVNNAGIGRVQKIADVSLADWDEMIRVNLSSAFYVTRAALPAMRAQRWGRIVMLSSIAAHDGGIVGPHYAASKAGLIGLAHNLARELAPEGITCNTLSPALIETDMVRGNPIAKPSLIPVGRFGTIEEVGSLVVELASNGYITGQTIGINGGRYMA